MKTLHTPNDYLYYTQLESLKFDLRNEQILSWKLKFYKRRSPYVQLENLEHPYDINIIFETDEPRFSCTYEIENINSRTILRKNSNCTKIYTTNFKNS